MHGTHEDLYERDFCAWTRREAGALRRWAATRPNLDLDLARIAEEIAGLGKEQRNALRSWTVRILEQLLLLEHSPATEPRRHWTREVLDFRAEVAARVTRTLRADLARRLLAALYDQARRQLVTALERFDEGETAARLPETCPYTLSQVIEDWSPGREIPARQGALCEALDMSRIGYPLKLPRSIKAAAERLAREDGVSLNQWIAAAVAEKVGSVEAAALFLRQRAGRCDRRRSAADAGNGAGRAARRGRSGRRCSLVARERKRKLWQVRPTTVSDA